MGINNLIDRKLVRNIDLVIVVSTILLILMGIIVISSAAKVLPSGYGSSAKFIKVQTVAFILGIIAVIFVLFIDYKSFGDYQWIIYGINIVILLSVFVFGSTVKGAKSWIDLGPISFQPAEIAKIGFILTFAKFLEKRKDNLNKIKDLLPCLLYIGIPVALIQMQPDTGTVLVFIFISAVMLFAAGLNIKIIIGSIIAFIASIPALWFLVLKPHQKNRILTFLNPQLDPMGKGYNVIQSKTAIGSGQIIGKGLYKGTQNNLGYVPEKHTDFIFSVIGEELGLIGAIVIIMLFFVLLLRCIHIAKVSKDSYGMLVCMGIMAMFLFHAFENIGMAIGVMPVTGIPLPFVSYGGSSLLTNMLAVGLILNVGMRRQIIRF